jgi:hypothetical protein
MTEKTLPKVETAQEWLRSGKAGTRHGKRNEAGTERERPLHRTYETMPRPIVLDAFPHPVNIE